MAVKSCKVTTVSGILKQTDDEFTLAFSVICDSKLDGPAFIYSQTATAVPPDIDAIPRKGGLWTYGNDALYASQARCVEIAIDRDGGQGDDPASAKWASTVTCRFSTEGENAENPLLKPTEYEWQGEMHQVPFEKDIITLRAVTNSAGQSFDPPVLRDDMRWVLTATRNEASFDATYAENFANKINSDTFQGKPPGSFKIGTPRARKQTDPVYGDYWTITYEFHYRRELWTQQILDQGRYIIDDYYTGLDPEGDSPTTVLVSAKESDGVTPVNDPILLNGAGKRNPMSADPVYLPYDAYEAVAFSTLGL